MTTRRAASTLALPGALLVLAALAALAPAPAVAGGRPQILGTLGQTFGVLGDVNDGGASLSLAAMWNVEDRLDLGVMLTADDLGTNVVDLLDPNDGAYLGKTQGLHRAAYGGAWRLDAHLPAVGNWDPFASGTWGWSRLRDDANGNTKEQWGSTGFTLAAGMRHPIKSHATLGGVLRYHRLFNDTAGRFLSFGLEWSWR
jgi:hypothetical protein